MLKVNLKKKMRVHHHSIKINVYFKFHLIPCNSCRETVPDKVPHKVWQTDGRTDNAKTISPSRFHRRGITKRGLHIWWSNFIKGNHPNSKAVETFTVYIHLYSPIKILQLKSVTALLSFPSSPCMTKIQMSSKQHVSRLLTFAVMLLASGFSP